MPKDPSVAVIGAGTMGNGIAHTFAQYGFPVTLFDIAQERLDKALQTIGSNLDRQVAKGTLTETAKTETLSRIRSVTDLSTGVAEKDLIVEAATEDVATKLKLFAAID